jgi:hypothetical protein
MVHWSVSVCNIIKSLPLHFATATQSSGSPTQFRVSSLLSCYVLHSSLLCILTLFWLLLYLPCNILCMRSCLACVRELPTSFLLVVFVAFFLLLWTCSVHHPLR